jgi:hypothetical protein
MSTAPVAYFDASFPGATQVVRVTNLHEAKIFARRWVIRDKDPALKMLLRHIEKVNSSATADSAIRQLKQALACRGMLVTASPSHEGASGAE